MPQRIPTNNQILQMGIPRVRVVDEIGKQLGVMDTREALRLAQERGLDLIGITDRVDPPVCKIMDYGKYLYQEEKKNRAAKQHQRGGEIKGIRLGFNISRHDIEIRVAQAEKFLKKGNKVLIEMRLRGRERTLQDVARGKFQLFLELLRERNVSYKVERDVRRDPRGMTMIIAKQ